MPDHKRNDSKKSEFDSNLRQQQQQQDNKRGGGQQGGRPGDTERTQARNTDRQSHGRREK